MIKKYSLLILALFVVAILISIDTSLIKPSVISGSELPHSVPSSSKFAERARETWTASPAPLDEKFDWAYSNLSKPGGTVAPLIADETGVYLGTGSSWFYAYNLNQTLKWKFRVERAHDGIVAKAVLNHGRVCFGATNETFYCLNKANGKVVFSATLPGVKFSEAPVVDGDTLSLTDSKIKIDLHDGRIVTAPTL